MVQLFPMMVPALIHNTQLDQRKVRLYSHTAITFYQLELRSEYDIFIAVL